MTAAVACLIFRRENLRSIVILITGLVLAAGALMLISRTPADLSAAEVGGRTFERIILAADVVLLILLIYYGRHYQSRLLIGHDKSALAIDNAVRALWMNSIGGAAFALALILIRSSTDTLDLQRLLTQGHHTADLLLPALALLCLSAFVKSAQFPFQRWLLGAMVAPTPVSALLHASTMVNVGIYLMLRLAPLIQGTFLSRCTAGYGGFVFLAAAALAVGQSNGKKVLANLYDQMAAPKVAVAVGACGLSGGIFRTAYNVIGGVDRVIPVDVYVPGCPPRPEAIIDGVIRALDCLNRPSGDRNLTRPY